MQRQYRLTEARIIEWIIWKMPTQIRYHDLLHLIIIMPVKDASLNCVLCLRRRVGIDDLHSEAIREIFG